MDHFATLALPRSLHLDLAELERRYLEASRLAHPDFHGQASPDRQRASLAQTAAINEAYLILKDPLARAEHLLALEHGPTALQEKNLDQTFLMEMMELREAIEESAQDGVALAHQEAALRDREQQFHNQVAGLWQQRDLKAMRRGLNAIRTLRSLIRDVQQKQDDMGA